MPMVVPLHAKQALNAQGTEDEPVLLMEVSDSSLGSTVLYYCSRPIQRISSDPLKYGIISNGIAYEYIITGTIPSDQEGTPLQAAIALDNVDQESTDAFIALTYNNQVTLKVVLASDPDSILRNIPNMFIISVGNTTDNMAITLSRNQNVLGAASNLEPWPAGLQTIVNAPGLHRQ